MSCIIKVCSLREMKLVDLLSSNCSLCFNSMGAHSCVGPSTWEAFNCWGPGDGWIFIFYYKGIPWRGILAKGSNPRDRCTFHIHTAKVKSGRKVKHKTPTTQCAVWTICINNRLKNMLIEFNFKTQAWPKVWRAEPWVAQTMNTPTTSSVGESVWIFTIGLGTCEFDRAMNVVVV